MPDGSDSDVDVLRSLIMSFLAVPLVIPRQIFDR
jgi:hypothetical protein